MPIANAHYDDLTWQQTNNTVAAGQGLTINAASIQNLNGTLAAQGNVNLTAQASVTNQSGTIQSVNGDVSINAPTLVNKAMDPVTLHKDYGDLNPPYAGGCNGGGSYKGSNCSASETVAAGPGAQSERPRQPDGQLAGFLNPTYSSDGREIPAKVRPEADPAAASCAADLQWAPHRYQIHRSVLQISNFQ